MDERMNLVLAILLTLCVSMGFGILATGILPTWVIGVCGFIIGLKVPGVILKFIEKEKS